MEWKAAAYTASMPVELLRHVKAFHDNFVNTGELNTHLLQLAFGIPGELVKELPELTGDPELLRKLQTKVMGIGARIHEARTAAKVEFPLDQLWNDYLKESVFQLSLWGSLRICYVAIYSAYDNFLARMVGVVLGQRVRTNQDFVKHLRNAFGEAICDRCWTQTPVLIARLARHSLAHAGGRVTDELRNLKHGFEVRDDRIQIVPRNVKALWALLKKNVTEVVEAAVAMDRFVT